MGMKASHGPTETADEGAPLDTSSEDLWGGHPTRRRRPLTAGFSSPIALPFMSRVHASLGPLGLRADA